MIQRVKLCGGLGRGNLSKVLSYMGPGTLALFVKTSPIPRFEPFLDPLAKRIFALIPANTIQRVQLCGGLGRGNLLKVLSYIRPGALAVFVKTSPIPRFEPFSDPLAEQLWLRVGHQANWSGTPSEFEWDAELSGAGELDRMQVQDVSRMGRELVSTQCIQSANWRPIGMELSP